MAAEMQASNESSDWESMSESATPPEIEESSSAFAPTHPTKPTPPTAARKGKVWGTGHEKKKTFAQLIQAKVDYLGPQQICGNPFHHKRVVSDDSIPVINHVSNIEVVAMMMPGHVAKCACDMRAMEALWYKAGQGNRQPNGTWSTRYVADGTYTMGVGDLKTPRKVFRVPYALSKEKFEVLHKDFPTLHIVCGGDYHDHPVAHTRTMVATWMLFEYVLASRKRTLDLHGSPISNGKHENVETVVEMCVPKDAVRKVTKWGPSEGFKEHTMRDITTHPSPETREWMGTFDQFVSVHTGYYYSMEEVTALLQHKEGSVLHMLMHRFSGEVGSLNDGEQTWFKRSVGESLTEVVQTNVLTGEKYVHPDNSHWFESNSWAPAPRETEDGMHHRAGVAWTMNMVGPDTYRFTVTACEGRIVANDPCKVQLRHAPVAPRADGDVKAIQRAGACSVQVGKDEVTLTVDAPVTYNKARMLVAGKPRGPKRFADHLAATKRIAKTENESTANIADVALASYFADFNRDRALNSTLFEGQFEQMREFENVMSGRSLTQYRTLFGKAIGLAAVVLAHSRSPGDKMAHAILSHVGREVEG